MSKLHVRKGDTVVVMSGDKRKGKGQKGKVLMASPKEGKIVVEGINKVIRHTKPRGAGKEGGRIEKEAPIYASKVMLYCSKCDRGVRYRRGINDKGNKVRICVKCGQVLE
jgi:large subunit ribosomal protein L24